ncbi:alpha/beta hydrolase family protein [Aneurinibacillus tyrosinisolvens]|uniref:alpha/beta hydrolase family protein n=1 Tax=Aneurinibacillus tyrosinisolvens TaxID=1443435 RepID=UPI00063F00D9|nr:alpha/beta hydrolase [Aneurinibacillus tyrosinisolvens]
MAQKTFQEENVTVSGEFPLKGTITIPVNAEQRYPAVLIIPGTGKNDRDGNSSLLRMNLYKDLAEFVANLGFVTLRYDKRGAGESGGVYEETGFWDFVEDAQACMRYLRSHPNVNPERVVLFGHSEGSLIAPAVNSRENTNGLVLVSGAGEPSKAFLQRQSEMAMQELESLTGFKGFLIRTLKLTEKSRKTNEKIIKQILESSSPTVRVRGKKLNAKWYREQYAYNVLEELEKVTCPTLAITGAKDIQVVPEQARVIAETVQGESEYHIIPEVNHILRKQSGIPSILTLIKTYKKQVQEPIDDAFLEPIAQWLQKFKTATH